MNSNRAPSFPCTIITAKPDDVDKAFHDLKRDMNQEFVHVFLDKIERYAAKPDRALFLASHLGKTIGFATIIDKSPAPEKSDRSTIRLLRDYACGTGLMVLPEFRRKRVASSLVQHWEQWARQIGSSGIWVVTHKMTNWYQHCFHYSILGTTVHHNVEKTILIKNFFNGINS